MAGEWQVVLLSELYEFSSGLSKPRSAFGTGYPFVSFKDVFYNIFIPDELVELVQSTEQERERCSVRRGDVFLTRTSETIDELGMSCVARHDILNATFNGFTKRLRPKDKRRVAPEYAGYYFRSPGFRQAVTAMSSMSTRASLNNEMLSRLSITLPPFGEQATIGHILGTLDDKIELNRQVNETLEAMARALFKSWFVDFDPVRAKAEGRAPGLPKPIADMFPDSFEDSELGEIPRGWGVVHLEDLAAIQGGKQLPTQDCQPIGKFPVFGANGIMGYANRTTHDDLVIAFGRVGAYCGSVHWTYSGAWINNNASSVVPNRWPEYVLQTMLEADFESMRTGSAQPFIPNSSLATLAVVRAPDQVMDEFCRMVRTLRLKEQSSQHQSRTVASLCDALLPKLICGELRVRAPVSESEHQA